MRKAMALILALALLLSQAGCGKGDTDTEAAAGNGASSQEQVTLEIFQFKVEIVDQLDALVADFEAEYPQIDVVLDTVGGGGDYAGALRSRMNSGNHPDIFNVGGPSELALWADFLEPLTDQPWVENSFDGTLDMITRDGEVYGQPYNLEGYGLIYHKDLFEQAGIDAASVRTLSDLEKVFATLESKKADLGIETVLSYSVGDSAWWTAAVHTMNVPFAMQEDPVAFGDGLDAGTASIVGNNRFEGLLDLFDLLFQYSYRNLLTVSYDDQVANFAMKKTAVLHQGNWTIGMLKEIDPDLDMAFLPIPLSDDTAWNDGSIPVGVPNYWVVNSQTTDAKKEAAKLFLDYIASSDRGAKFLVEDCQFIPAFSNVDLEPADSLSASIIEYSKAGKTIPWMWPYYPAGYLDVPIKDNIQLYYQGNITKEQFLANLDKAWQDMK
ncbi:ABC transporter substrate-binding protein [Anaerotalea alkaliphila]|uniref:Carbohydrate ABC transporter substrate-binding protein n=1 Tax=Anaerotalea alkaliphila TaxID=2662126 RepID=A0A7X5HV99_9FIRM|nr:ABC transporter substrate-binding protein [Anaerotalea alkaliphila]NDL67280.1 carbohydrate ABC transporter substrate-binding protein [Anaerotalea alkaliphila]